MMIKHITSNQHIYGDNTNNDDTKLTTIILIIISNHHHHRDEVRNNDTQIVVYKVIGCMRMRKISVMKNNNLLYEYVANSATTTINHYML